MRKSDEILTLEKDNFVGQYFKGNKYNDCAVIFFPGAKLSEERTLPMAEFLINEGYNVLVVGYYLWRDLPKEMWGIPVDYAENAVKWLQNKEIKNIAVHGASTGSGYALLSASLIPEISCVVAVSPFEYVMEGMKNELIPQHCSQYTWKGKDVPYCSYAGLDKMSFMQAVRTFFKNRGDKYKLKDIGRYSYDTASISEEARIKIENMKADLLLIAPQFDNCWPSETSVPRMLQLLKEKGYSYKVESTIYEYGSHLLGYAPPEMIESKRKLYAKMMPVEKDYPVECEKARKDSTKLILDFIDKWAKEKTKQYEDSTENTKVIKNDLGQQIDIDTKNCEQTER